MFTIVIDLVTMHEIYYEAFVVLKRIIETNEHKGVSKTTFT
jgi:hypothetical protein